MEDRSRARFRATRRAFRRSGPGLIVARADRDRAALVESLRAVAPQLPLVEARNASDAVALVRTTRELGSVWVDVEHGTGISVLDAARRYEPRAARVVLTGAPANLADAVRHRDPVAVVLKPIHRRAVRDAFAAVVARNAKCRERERKKRTLR